MDRRHPDFRNRAADQLGEHPLNVFFVGLHFGFSDLLDFPCVSHLGFAHQGSHDVVDIPDTAGGLDHHRVALLEILRGPVVETVHLNPPGAQGPFLVAVLTIDHQ